MASPKCGESCESVFACGLSMHQKCSNSALTNLLFGLCRSAWIIEPLINLLSPHPEAPTRPSTPEVLRHLNFDMLPFGLSGTHMELQAKAPFTSSIIGLASNNGEASCWMWVLLDYCVQILFSICPFKILTSFLLFTCKKKNLNEEADMPTCNLFETVHNIWFQKYNKGYLLHCSNV